MNSGEGKKVSGKAYDPICGVRVESGEGVPSSEYKKRRYYFCSEKCRHKFAEQTEKFRLNELARAGALFSPNDISTPSSSRLIPKAGAPLNSIPPRCPV